MDTNDILKEKVLNHICCNICSNEMCKAYGEYHCDDLDCIKSQIKQAVKEAVIEALGEVRESVFKNSVMILMNSHFINQAKSETLKGVVEEIDQKIKALKVGIKRGNQ